VFDIKESTMKKHVVNIVLWMIVVLFTSCRTDDGSIKELIVEKDRLNNQQESSESVDFQYLSAEGTNIADRINCPEGFVRIDVSSDSFGYFLRNLELKPDGSDVMLYDGSKKANQNVHVAVLTIDVGDRDLQQCADATMRLWAEYLRSEGRDEEIHFNFTNGFRVDYSKWMEGYRVKVDGNDVSWIKSRLPSNTYETFMDYLKTIFIYAGTLSLSEELESVTLTDLQIGDVFVQGGSPGHAVIVVDMAINIETDQKIFLLAQSYMPAQDIHVLINPNDDDLGPWYILDDRDIYLTPEWKFDKDSLKRYR
jgi:hypothetical protein